MASQGPNSPGTAADDSAVGAIAWASAVSAKVSDNTYANISTANVTSHYLKCTNYGFSIPSGATIDGILVEIERKASQSTTINKVTDNIVKLVKGGSVVGNNNASVTRWTTAEAYFSYGSSSDLWGTSWTDSDINASTFGVVLSGTWTYGGGKGTVTGQVDHIRITVYYTTGGGGGSQTDAIFFAGD